MQLFQTQSDEMNDGHDIPIMNAFYALCAKNDNVTSFVLFFVASKVGNKEKQAPKKAPTGGKI
jgi:hypothetical protein